MPDPFTRGKMHLSVSPRHGTKPEEVTVDQEFDLNTQAVHLSLRFDHKGKAYTFNITPHLNFNFAKSETGAPHFDIWINTQEGGRDIFNGDVFANVKHNPLREAEHWNDALAVGTEAFNIVDDEEEEEDNNDDDFNDSYDDPDSDYASGDDDPDN